MLCICFEYMSHDIMSVESDAKAFLLLLAVGLQREERIAQLKRSIRIITGIVDQGHLQLNSTESEVILYSIAMCLYSVPVTDLSSIIDLCGVSTYNSIKIN